MRNKKLIFFALLLIFFLSISFANADEDMSFVDLDNPQFSQGNDICDDDCLNDNEFDTEEREIIDENNELINSDSSFEVINNYPKSKSKLSDYGIDYDGDGIYDEYVFDDDYLEGLDDYIKPMTIHYDNDNRHDCYSLDHLIEYCTVHGNFLKIYRGNTLIVNKNVGYGESTQLINTLFDSVNYKPSSGVYITKIEDENGKVWANSTITILKSTTTLRFSKINVYKGKYIYLNNDEENQHLDSKHADYSYITGTIKITINGKTYTAKVKGGDFHLKIKAPSKCKTYLCKASFSGDSLYAPCSTNFKLTIKNPFKTKITVKNIKTKINAKYAVKAYIKYKGTGAKINKGYVKFKINGKSYKVKVSHGLAKLKLKAPSKNKTFKCFAKYLGNKKASKSSTHFKVTVKKPVKKTQKYIYFQLPVKDYTVFSKTKGKYKFTTYRYINYTPNVHKTLRMRFYKNGKVQKDYYAIFKMHFTLGYWRKFSRDGAWKTIREDNVGYVDKVKVKIWI